MGARPGHPLLDRYADALEAIDQPRPQWRNTGPAQLTNAIRDGDEIDVVILSAWTFLKQTAAGDPATGGEPYGEHFFSSTADRSATWTGARPTPPDRYGCETTSIMS